MNTCLPAGRELEEVQVSNLRGEAANWKQQAMVRITEAGKIKNKIGALPRKTNYKLYYA